MRPLPLPVAVEVCKSNHKGIFSLRRNGVTFPKMFFTTIRFLPHCNRIVVYSTVDARHIRLQPLIINVVVSEHRASNKHARRKVKEEEAQCHDSIQ